MKSILAKIRVWIWPVAAVCATGCQSSSHCADPARSYRERAYELIDAMVEYHCEELKKISASRSPDDMFEFSRRLEKASRDFGEKVSSIGLGADSVVRLEKKLARGVNQ